MMTVSEVAARLNLEPGTVRAHIRLGNLQSRLASPEEIAVLLSEGRIQGVTSRGVRVIDESEFHRYATPNRRSSTGSGKKPRNTS